MPPFGLGLEPLSETSLLALSLRVCFQVVLAADVSFGCTPVFFTVPCYGYMFASTTLAPGLGLSLAPYPRSCRMGLEPLSEAPLCALQLLAPSFLVVLAEGACLRRLLDLHCASMTVGTIPGPPALHFLLSAGCLWCLENSPSG